MQPPQDINLFRHDINLLLVVILSSEHSFCTSYGRRNKNTHTRNPAARLPKDTHILPVVHTETDDEEDEVNENKIGFTGQKRPIHKKGFDDFRSLKTIGEGAYGKVYQVQDKETNKIYAMKVLKKAHLLKKKAIMCTITEKDILRKIRHPFIVKLYCTFQNLERVGFVMEYVNGGQLFYHMRKLSNFDEDTTRFYAAEIILALEHLHSHNIIHRDLKPENILITAQGHVCLTDFGLAKEQVTNDEGASTFCGTMEYIPPEMIQGLKYGKPADFWSATLQER